MKNNKTKKKRIFGGKKLGEGQFGTVYSPPLRCLEGDDDIWATPDFVSKTIYEGALEKEYRNSFLVKELDPNNDWSITALHVCTINPTQNNANYNHGEPTHQLIFKNGGQSLSDLLLKPGIKGDTSKYIMGINDSGLKDQTVFQKLNPDSLPILIEQVKKILPGLEILNTKYVHEDLHFGNIVTDGINPRIIDFSSLQSLEKKIAAEQKVYNRCLTINGKTSSCVWLNERIRLLIEDDAKSRDTHTLWSQLHTLLDSEWVKQTFPGKYSAWLKKYDDLTRFVNFCPEYALSIMNVP